MADPDRCHRSRLYTPSMATRAQLSQERSRQRREELLAAAIELFAEGGARSVTHRAVAARAGLPPATTTYYFESIDDLIRDALASHVVSWTSGLDDLATSSAEVSATLELGAKYVASVFAQRSPEIGALELSVYLASCREPQLRALAAEAVRRLETIAAGMLERIGIAEPGDLPASIVALIVGTAVRRQSGVHDDEVEARLLAGASRALISAHLLGEDAVNRALGDLTQRDDG